MRNIIIFFIAISALTSCKMLKPSVMMKTPKGYKYATPPEKPLVEYKLAVNDEISFSMYTNDGFRRVDISSLTNENYQKISATFNYIIEYDGTSKLPLLGRVPLKGLTIREAELMLEQKYAEFFQKPYVLISVTNRRVIVFPGSEGSAKVVPLANEQTTLIEALALAGGLSITGKAYRIKLIRGDLKNPEVYLIDLSTIDGIKSAELVLQANDIIYVEPRLQIGRTVINEITPYITFITSAVIFYEFLRTR
ncbi:MAG: polysaccharide biosynthesis/export family protein [Bacteroidia bacterium]|nr:polysaccharide biosynthesis/export family protein [Bacteroidia bacterium]